MPVIETLCLLEPAVPDSAVLPSLTPAQSKVCDDLKQALTPGSLAILRGDAGLGKTTIIRALQSQLGGVTLAAKDFLALLMKREPVAIEETFLELVQGTFEAHDTVFLDDFHLMIDLVLGFDYPRAHLFGAVMSTILEEADQRRKRLVFSIRGDATLQAFEKRCYTWQIEELEAADYRQMASPHLAGEDAQNVDWEKIHHFAPSLNGYQPRNAAQWLMREGKIDADAFLEHLQSAT